NSIVVGEADRHFIEIVPIKENIFNLVFFLMYSVSFITDYPLFDFLFIRYYFMLTN
ncbi:hypothetical protein ACJX0J_038110, partial [Zea mays]